MAISHPRNDVMDALGIVSTQFVELRRDEQSRAASGQTLTAELGTPLWQVEIRTKPYLYDEGAAIEAIRSSLGGGRPFYVYDARHPYPTKHNDGSFNDTGTLLNVRNGDEIRLDNLDGGFELSPGDYVAFDYGAGPSRALHRVLESITADGSGTTGWVQVFPHVRPGYSTGSSVILKKPAMLAVLKPSSWTVTDEPPYRASYSFTAVQYL